MFAERATHDFGYGDLEMDVRAEKQLCPAVWPRDTNGEHGAHDVLLASKFVFRNWSSPGGHSGLCTWTSVVCRVNTVVVLGSNYYSHAEYVLTKCSGSGGLVSWSLFQDWRAEDPTEWPAGQAEEKDYFSQVQEPRINRALVCIRGEVGLGLTTGCAQLRRAKTQREKMINFFLFTKI